jgi:hypothetical protein
MTGRQTRETSVVVINFSHPLTTDNLRQIEQLVAVPVSQVIDRPVQFDWDQSFADQARDLVAGIGISGEDWQRLPIVVNLPGLSTAAAAVIAELHGRTGSFPPVLLRRRQDTFNQFAVTEILDLNAIRDAARHERARETNP